jgi:hypothetical protein
MAIHKPYAIFGPVSKCFDIRQDDRHLARLLDECTMRITDQPEGVIMDDYSRLLNLIGLTVGLIGVLILFRWGMPFRVSFGNGSAILSQSLTPSEEVKDRIYTICGWVGLVFLILGWAVQVIAILMPPTKLPSP